MVELGLEILGHCVMHGEFKANALPAHRVRTVSSVYSC